MTEAQSLCQDCWRPYGTKIRINYCASDSGSIQPSAVMSRAAALLCFLTAPLARVSFSSREQSGAESGLLLRSISTGGMGGALDTGRTQSLDRLGAGRHALAAGGGGRFSLSTDSFGTPQYLGLMPFGSGNSVGLKVRRAVSFASLSRRAAGGKYSVDWNMSV